MRQRFAESLKEVLMHKSINIDCPRCRHRWPITYAALQTVKVLYKGLAAHEEEYAIPCPRCGETSVQILKLKGGDANHE